MLATAILFVGPDSGIGPKQAAVLAATVGGAWLAWAHAAQDPDWSVAYAWSLLTGVSLALLASTLSAMLGTVMPCRPASPHGVWSARSESGGGRQAFGMKVAVA